MFVLRQVVCFFIGAGCVLSISAAQLSVSTSRTDIQAEKNALTPQQKLTTDISTTTVAMNELKILSNWKSSIQYSRSHSAADYSAYDFMGIETFHKNTVDEQTVSLDQIINFGPHIFEFVTSSNMGTSFVRKSNVSLNYLKKVNEYNLFGVGLAWQRQITPLSYFSNPISGQREARPTQLDTQSLTLQYERIFSSRYKARFEVPLSQRTQDRPLSYGLEVKNVYAFTDSMGFRADMGYLQENTSEKLRSDLGYQSSGWLETKWIHTASSFWTWGLGYAVEAHRERKPWQNLTEQLGSDAALVDVTYEASKWSATLAGGWVKYNTGQDGLQIQGELQWSL